MTSGTTTVTVLFTDVVGSTELRTDRGDASAQQIMETHFGLVREQIEQHSGQEVKTIGDSFMVAFSAARRAVNCAVAVQRALEVHNRDNPDKEIQVRIGLHTGDVIQKEGDLFGAGVDAAARIVSEATGGQVLVSEAVHSVIGPAKDVDFIDRGLFQLKGLPDPWRLYEIVWQQQEARGPLSEEKTTPSIAVLPFTDMSPQKDQEYFCDGMSEALINELTHIEQLRVIARTSAFSFKGQSLDVRDIGRKLNVATVLEGSVQKSGNRLRITAQLVDTVGGHHLWSERYDREMEDVFAIQDEISQAVVDKLQVELLGREEARLAKRHTVDLEVYNLYLKGRFFWNKRGEEGLKKAIEYFEQAIGRDLEYAPAYTGLADSYVLLPLYVPFPSKEALTKAREAALRALEIDDTLGEAHTSLAWVKSTYEWDWVGGEKEFKRAIEFNPGYATVHEWYAYHLMWMARFDEAIKEIQRALELDPLSVVINRAAGEMFCFARQHDQAIEALQKTLEMDPNFPYTHYLLGLAYLGESMYGEALAEFQIEKEVSASWNLAPETTTGVAYALMGKREKAQEVLDDCIERSEREYVSPLPLAALCFVLGQNDQGFEWLEKAYEERDQRLHYLKVSPGYDSVRSDPRFTALLKKMGLEK